jgi:hypothetical protein
MKRIIGIFCFVLFCFAQNANAQYRTELLFGGFGGVSQFIYTSELGKSKMGFAAGGDLSIAIMFNKYFGIKIGAGASFYNTNFNIPQIGGKARYWDGHTDANDTLVYTYAIDNFDEKISLLYGMVPVMLCVQTPGKVGFSFAAGAKVGLPVKATNNRHIDHLNATWYYPAFDVAGDSSLFIGFGNFYGSLPPDNIASLPDLKGNIKVGLMLNVVAELGLRIRMGNRGLFYLLIYGEYGLINTLDKNRQIRDLIIWDAQTVGAFKRNNVSALNGLTMVNNESVPIIKTVVPLSFGIKIAFGIGMGKDLGEPGD